MDHIRPFLDAVPLPVLLLAPILGALIFLLVPPRLRLSVALIAVVPYMTAGQLPGLGMVYLVCKATGWAALIAVAVAAFLQPGPTRRPHWIAWVYVGAAAIAPAFVLTTVDNVLAVALRFQWLAMVLAAIAVVRTVHDGPSLERVIRSLQIGYAIGLLVPFSDLVIRRGGAFAPGLGRFSPYEANSNQIGVFLAAGFVFNFYFALRDRHLPLRVVWAGFAAMALGMVLLTKSRSTALVCLVPALPLLAHAMRKPVLAMSIIGVMGAGAVYVISQVADLFSLERYRTLETARVQDGLDYIMLTISQRPVFGLLGTSGLDSEVSSEVGTHPHNAYLMTAYTGGIVLLLPMLLIAAISMLSAAYVWRHRRKFDVDPLLTSTLCVLMIMIYADGFESHTIIYPTYIWALVNVILSLLLTTMAAEAHRARRAMPDTHAAISDRPALA